MTTEILEPSRNFGNQRRIKQAISPDYSNLANSGDTFHNDEMNSPFFVDFLQHVAVGTASVFALFLIIWVSTPRKSWQEASQRTSR